MSYKVVVIGAGQLGSRHLQGVLKSDLDLDVYVVDPVIASLEVAKERANEIEHRHSITYITSIDELPELLDLVIVATNADVRAAVTEELVNNKAVKYLILEKVLFQDVADYDRIEKLLEDKSVKTWVNHPRRYQTFYAKVKEELELSNQTSIEVYGKNWGLGCNGLHMLDMISYVTNSNVASLSTSLLDSDVLESKRAGFVEFTGAISGRLENGSEYIIRSLFSDDGAIKPLTITICTPETRIVVQEGGKTQVVVMKSSNNYVPEVSEHDMLFQSDLSMFLVRDIFSIGSCELPLFKEASITHKLFIAALLEFYNLKTNQNLDKCPIT